MPGAAAVVFLAPGRPLPPLPCAELQLITCPGCRKEVAHHRDGLCSWCWYLRQHPDWRCPTAGEA